MSKLGKMKKKLSARKRVTIKLLVELASLLPRGWWVHESKFQYDLEDGKGVRPGKRWDLYKGNLRQSHTFSPNEMATIIMNMAQFRLIWLKVSK